MKKVVLISSVIITFIIGTFYYYSDSQKYVLESVSSNQKVKNSNSLTMMYETEYQSGEYQVSNDTMWPQDGYTFNETLSKCENGGILTWDDENKKVVLQTSTSDKCFIYFDKEPVIIYLANYIINNVYTGTDGDNALYYHDGVGSYINADQEAGDYSYRYSGTNPNNFVCFGSDEEVCPEDNLYRIIGVFDGQVKLIKVTSYGSYAWDSGDSNTWDNITKPDIRSTLNNIFLESFNSMWQEKISTHTWQVGGMAIDTTATVKQYYFLEVGSNLNSTLDSMKIGLMYVSDYGYAASPENYTIVLSNYSNSTNIENNWLYSSFDEWTISRNVNRSVASFSIDADGVPVANGSRGDSVSTERSIRPCFFLNSSVQYISGSGIQTDPYRIF